MKHMRAWQMMALALAGCASAAPSTTSDNSLPATPRPAFATVDRTYSPTIRTVQLFKQGFELAPPVIELGGTEQLVLRFDDLQPYTENLSYTMVHCDHAWQPSDLMPGQYLEGATTAYLPAGSTSYNTLQPFIQYELTLPNSEMRPIRSGNYLLKVFRGSDEEDLVLTRRFLVFEQRAAVNAQVQATRQVDLRDMAQQLDFVVNTNALPVLDPFGEVHVTLLQNFRWDDARAGAKPRFVRGTELVYDFPDQGLFMGGNEYRNFDLKNLRFATQRIARIVPGIGERIYEAWLLPETRRSIRRYNSEPDINGRYLVRNDQVDGDPLGADYLKVHFKLPLEAPLANAVYIYGQLSDFQCKEEFRMRYSPEDTAYVAEPLLKQGFYDFSFVTLPQGSSAPDIAAIEGSHFQTENDYLVLVYFTDRNQRLDRLVGLRFVNSARP